MGNEPIVFPSTPTVTYTNQRDIVHDKIEHFVTKFWILLEPNTEKANTFQPWILHFLRN